MTLLLMLLLKSFLVFALSGAVLLCLRRASASARHLVCLLTLAALLALPLFSLTLPGWHMAGLTTMRDAEPTLADQEPTPFRPSPTLPEREGEEFKRRPVIKTLHPPAPGGPLRSEARTKQGGGFIMQEDRFLPLYLLGLLLASVRPLLGLWGIAHLRRACVSVTDAPTLSVSADCAAALRLSRLPQLCQADVPVPMTWGWLRPMVLLPSGSEDWPEDRLRSVLLHEMAHIKRRDWTCHRLADIACALYWFHPLVWLTARRLRSESEIACDDLVLSLGIAAPDYARHLLEIAGALSRPLPGQSAIAIAQTPHIKRRILMVLDKTHSRRTVTRRALLLALIPSAAALLTLAALRPMARAQETAAPADATLPAMSGTPVKIAGIAAAEVSGNQWTGRANGSWWDQNGVIFSEPVDDTDANHQIGLPVNQDQKLVMVAFTVPAALKGASFAYDFAQSSSSGSYSGHRTKGKRVVVATFPAALTKTNLRAGVASGPWTVAQTSQGQFSSTTSGSGQTIQTIIFSPAVDTASGLVLTVTMQGIKDDVRIVAVDRAGHEILPGSVGDSGGTGSITQSTGSFALPRQQLKEFRVETRPFQWIEFKDVALQPAESPVASTPARPTTPAEWQTPWTSSDIHSTWNLKTPTYHMQIHIAPTVSGTHPDPPVTGKLASGPGQASHFAVTAWKPGQSNVLTAKFDYTPKQADKVHPDTIHLLTKTGAVAAIVRYSAD